MESSGWALPSREAWGVVCSVLLLACDGSGGETVEDPEDPCLPGGTPSLTIGEGRGSFRALSDGDTVTLVHGAQGGFHVEVGLEAENIDASDLISGRIEGLAGGQVIADSAPWLDFRCNPDVPALQSWGTRLIFAMTPSELDGLEVTVQVSLTDVAGTELSAERQIVIEDEP